MSKKLKEEVDKDPNELLREACREISGMKISREQEKKRTDEVKAQLEANISAMRQEFEAELSRLSQENEKLEEQLTSKQNLIHQLEAGVERVRMEVAKERGKTRDTEQQFIGAKKMVQSIFEELLG